MTFKYLGKKPPVPMYKPNRHLNAEHFRGALKEAADALQGFQRLEYLDRERMKDYVETRSKEIRHLLRVSAGEGDVMGAQFEIICHDCKVETNCDKSHEAGEFIESYWNDLKNHVRVIPMKREDRLRLPYDKLWLAWGLDFLEKHRDHRVVYGWEIYEW